MSSSLSRQEIVIEALTRAGRGVELRTLAEGMLNRMLRQWAFEYKYPENRKIAPISTLTPGSQSVVLPADFGAGVDSLSVGGGSPIFEMTSEDFFNKFQLQSPGQYAAGSPSAFYVDRGAGKLIFSSIPNEGYPVGLVYFAVPTDIPVSDSDGDNAKVWMSDDELVIQGLIAKIYQYNQDTREKEQVMYVEALKNAYRRGTVPSSGGSNRIRLSRRRFRTRSN